MENSLIEKTVGYVQQEMSGNDSSHDWNHIDRVRKLAKFLAIREGFNESEQLEVDLSSLLHDIKDWKYSNSSTETEDAVRSFLKEQQVDQQIIDKVCYVVANIGFSKQLESGINPLKPHDYMKILAVVQDADRLDAMGAMGVARCLTYGGAKNRILYDPSIPPRNHLNEKEYKYGLSTTMNHFYEKLFKLKDMMKTTSGRQIAEHRQKFMENFVKQFELEWNSGDLEMALDTFI